MKLDHCSTCRKRSVEQPSIFDVDIVLQIPRLMWPPAWPSIMTAPQTRSGPPGRLIDRWADRHTCITEYTWSAAHVESARHVQRDRLLVSWIIIHPFTPEHGTTPGAVIQRCTHTYSESVLIRPRGDERPGWLVSRPMIEPGFSIARLTS